LNILICGVPQQKLQYLDGLVPGANLRGVSGRDSDRDWQRLVVPSDFCIIIPKHMSHKNMSVVRQVFGRRYLNADNFNHAIRLANEIVQNVNNNDGDANSWWTR